MFSALRHYPAVQYRLKSFVPVAGLGQDRRVFDSHVDVSGGDRYKYFKRPVMPYMPTLGGQIVYAKRPIQLIHQQAPKPVSPFQKTISTQTVYRDSDAQTDPYSPEYIFQNSSQPPELLALATLTYGMGLPAGMAELEMIERARIKRAWEKQLPEVQDEHSFKKRLQMMEEMELREWTDREKEIQHLQNERLRVLEQVIEQRDNDNQVANDERISTIWQNKMREREAEFAKINRKRIKAIRMLTDKRSKIENRMKKRDIIQEYGDYGSSVYAPKANEGKSKGQQISNLEKTIEDTKTFQSKWNANLDLLDLEKALPETALKANISLPGPPKLRTLEDRKHEQHKVELEQMSARILERKTTDTQSKAPMPYAVKIERPPSRAETPEINVPSDETEEMHIAALMLQKTIRGRIVQAQMYIGTNEFTQEKSVAWI